MALLFMDGFEQYSSGGTEISSPSTYYSSVNAMPGRWISAVVSGGTLGISTASYKTTQPGGGGASMSWGGYAGYSATCNIPVSTTVITGFHVACASAFANNTPICNVSDAAGSSPSTGIRVEYNANGSLQVKNNSNSSVYFTTSANDLVPGPWHHFELKVVFGVSGSIELYIDGSLIGSASSIDTRGGISGSGYTMVTLNSAAQVRYFDDFFICDATGTRNNTVMGPVAVYTLAPSANTGTVQMTPVSAASNYLCVSERIHNSNTNYVRATSSNLTDLYEVQDLTTTPTAICAVSVASTSMKADALTRKVNNLINVSGGTTLNGTLTSPINGSYRTTYDLYETTPAGATWTLADVNGLQIGVKSS